MPIGRWPPARPGWPRSSARPSRPGPACSPRTWPRRGSGASTSASTTCRSRSADSPAAAPMRASRPSPTSSSAATSRSPARAPATSLCSKVPAAPAEPPIVPPTILAIRMHSRRARGLIAAGVLPLAAGAARADELKIGMSGALTGPAQALGQGMKAGIEAYFARVNAAGGVAGHMLRLVALDDGYEPARAGANVRKLIEVERVFAILGNPGTPTAAVAVPIAVEHKVPFFGAFTGAGLLRKTPPDRYVINFRASS